MAVDIIPQLDKMSIVESPWTVISGADESPHENGNYESCATSSGGSSTASFAGSSNSSFSSISGTEMLLPKSIVKKRRVGSDIGESYGQVTIEDDGSEGAVTEDEFDDYAKSGEVENSYIDLGECDADDESSDKDSDSDSDEDTDDEEDSDGESIADSYQELDEELSPNMSFISFTESVSFDMTISYAEPPVFDDSDDDSEDDSEDDLEETMTVHEKMARAMANGCSAHSIDGTPNLGTPVEHGLDVLDVDKRLLAAYVNGIRSTGDIYKNDLASLALNINEGLSTQPFLSSNVTTEDGLYLNHALKHLLGIFPYIIDDDELDILIYDAIHEDHTFQNAPGKGNCRSRPTTGKSSLHEDVSQLLKDRLIDRSMGVEEEVLDFFTRGVIYVLKTWAPFRDY